MQFPPRADGAPVHLSVVVVPDLACSSAGLVPPSTPKSLSNQNFPNAPPLLSTAFQSSDKP
jgi:hypothetical protein